jgi:cation diffusion facilitator family transporter
VATLIVGSITFVLFLEILRAAIEKLIHPTTTQVHPIAFAAMVVSLALNVTTVLYEGGMGRKLKSEFLIADSTETKSDIFISAGVFVSLFFIRTGWMWVDGVVTLVIGLIVLKNSIGIYKSAAGILTDESILDAGQVIETATKHPDVRWCHAVRSRGKPDSIYLDLHLGLDSSTTVKEAHDRITHEVKELLLAQFPGVRCVTVHVEPDTEDARSRKRSVFKKRDY